MQRITSINSATDVIPLRDDIRFHSITDDIPQRDVIRSIRQIGDHPSKGRMSSLKGMTSVYCSFSNISNIFRNLLKQSYQKIRYKQTTIFEKNINFSHSELSIKPL